MLLSYKKCTPYEQAHFDSLTAGISFAFDVCVIGSQLKSYYKINLFISKAAEDIQTTCLFAVLLMIINIEHRLLSVLCLL